MTATPDKSQGSGAISGSHPSDHAPAGHGASRVDPGRKFTPTQLAYILSTPLQQPTEACVVVHLAGCGSSGDFATFARRNKTLFERKRNYADTMFLYRLTEEGADLKRDAEQVSA